MNLQKVDHTTGLIMPDNPREYKDGQTQRLSLRPAALSVRRTARTKLRVFRRWW